MAVKKRNSKIKRTAEVVGNPFLERKKNTVNFIPEGMGQEFISEMPIIDDTVPPGFGNPQDIAKGGSIKVKKAAFGSLIRNMLHGKKTTTEDSAAPYRQTFNVKDSETGEIKNIMQDFKPIQSQNNSNNDMGLIGRLFGAIRNKPTQNVGPLKHDFYVKDQFGQNVNLAEKKSGGLVRQGYPKIAKKGWK